MKSRLSISGSAKTSVHRPWMICIATALALTGSAPRCWSGPSNQTNRVRSASSSPWRDNQVIQPEALAKTLSATTGNKPLVICVGFPVLYAGAHITGAKFAGPASRPEGLQALKREVRDLPREKPIVLYCGCCPWTRCPNIRPAFRTLQDLGFTNVKALSIPTDFRKDWVAKGFPTQKGPEKK